MNHHDDKYTNYFIYGDKLSYIQWWHMSSEGVFFNSMSGLTVEKPKHCNSNSLWREPTGYW